MQIRRLALIVIGIMASLFLIPVHTHANDKFKIGFVYAMANAPAIIAESRGLFAKNGLDVELRQFNSGPLVKRALAAGDLHMAYIGMPPVYHAYAEGQHFKIVSKVNYGQAAIITSQNSPIRKLADLRNKRIGNVRDGSGMDVLLRGYILGELAGLDSHKDVEIVSMPAKIMQASVQRGLVDAAFTWEPYVAQAIVAGDARVLFDMNKQIPHYPWYVLVATETVLNTQREKVMRVLKAHKEAVRILNEEPDAGAKILIETFNLGNVISVAGVKAKPIDIVHQARQRLGWEYEFKSSDKAFLQRLIDYSLKLGYIDKPINAKDLLDQSAINGQNGP
jgi:NitT/TauT family transport system substrate-binding protein